MQFLQQSLSILVGQHRYAVRYWKHQPVFILKPTNSLFNIGDPDLLLQITLLSVLCFYLPLD